VTALQLLQELRPATTIIGADPVPDSYAVHLTDAFLPLPRISPGAEADYQSAFLDLVDEWAPNAVMPCHSLERVCYAEMADDLDARGVAWPRTNRRDARVAADKVLLYDWLTSRQVAVPRYLTMDSHDDSPWDIRSIVKRRVGSGGVGAKVVDSGQRVPADLLAGDEPYVRQAYVDGPEFSLDGVRLSDGRTLGPVCRVRRRQWHGISVVNELVDLTEPARMAYLRVADGLEIVGPLNVQGFEFGGDFHVTDVNPRFPAGGLGAALALGLNIPLLAAVDLLRGPAGIRWERPPFRPLTHYRVLSDVIIEGGLADGF
jgi:hypothetical protein